MRKNIGVKTYLYPQPVLVIATYNEDNSPNAMTAAWGGMSDYDKVSIALSDHKSTKNILRNKAFTISIGTKETAAACDYVGLVSGEKVPDKFKKAGFTAESGMVNAPLIKELPLAVECEFVSFENEVLLGKIINVSVDDSLINEDGSVDSSRFNPICFDPITHNYLSLGDAVAKAFEVGKNIK